MFFLKTKILSLLFICLTAIPLLFSIYFFISQQLVRYSMNEALEKEVLHTITIAPDSIIWVSFGREILVNGHLFDIEFYTHVGNVMHLTGLYDTEEDDLNKQLDIMEQHKSKDNPNNILLVSFLFQFFFTKVNSVFYQHPECIALNKPGFPVKEDLYFTSLSVLLPPPKCS